MKYINLTQGKVAIVDDEDFELLSGFKWHFTSHGYARRNGKMVKRKKEPSVLMHRQLFKVETGMQVDHINGNKLDNRRCNLRICTNAENTRNSKKKAGTSKYKGVGWFKRDGLWQARIKVNYKGIHLGYFNDECDAALAYNFAAIKYHGEFARLNVAGAAI